MLVVPGNIKEVGEYVARVRLHKDITVEIPFTVKSDAPVVAAPVVEEEVVVAEARNRSNGRGARSISTLFRNHRSQLIERGAHQLGTSLFFFVL